MPSVQFEYELPANEYVAAQLLYYKSLGRRRRIGRPARWIVAGAVCIVSGVRSAPPASSEGSANFSFFLLTAIGVWWMWAGIGMLFPAKRFRRAYDSSALAGKLYRAEVGEGGLQVAGEFCEWSVKWPGVQFKREDERVLYFMPPIPCLSSGKNSSAATNRKNFASSVD